ncbi:non-ribosomal peptide synthetase [Xenorhabdus innexi]|uniref:Amino acid adenylation n=1 Tax=Xenorhabdus innexi TaxID=290109 RepID=A0A1N6MW62_9GAMM|nr:non-ribosomal peptide synthetase [Xenorhabdus innexi]PHM37495.1 Amino acid adenylation [Xenorhabdus innexi]SIP73027.1 Non-ribosomal peptide synthetase [Xenorhabdus innexi]
MLHDNSSQISSVVSNDNHPCSAPHPLSSPQQVIWFDQALRPDSYDYNINIFICIEGELNEELFVRAFEQVVHSNDSMRLQFINTHGLPEQKVVNPLPVSMDILDFSSYPDAKVRVKTHIDAQLRRPFQLNNDVLWRTSLLRVSNTCRYWQLCCHHLIIDGAGIFILSERLLDTYNRLIKGEVADNSSFSYLDFIGDERHYFASDNYSHDMQFWSKRYEKLPPPLLRPVHSNNPTNQHPNPVATQPVIWSMDQALFKRIETAVGGRKRPFLHFMYAVLACYFARTTDLNDIVIGVPLHNRKNSRQRQTVGMFAAVFPIGITVIPEDTFRDVMDKVAAEMQRCHKHQSFPIVELSRQRHSRQKTENTELFHITLSFESIEVNFQIEGEDTRLKFFEMQSGVPYPLTIKIKHHTDIAHPKNTPSPISIEFHASPDYLSGQEVITLRSRLSVLLNAALTTLETPSLTNTKIVNLPILPDIERQQVLVNFNATQAEFPQDALIHQLFESQAQRTPDAIAAVFEKQSLSYAELNRRANRLAHHLIALGIQPDDRVAICVERSLEMVVGILGILKAGGAFVPLDPAYPSNRLTYMFTDSAPVALVTQSTVAEIGNDNLPTILLDIPSYSVLDENSAENPDIQALGLTSRHLAYVIYTSGSTGQPKGVMVEHRSLSNLITTQQDKLNITPESRLLQFASNSFDACIWECFMALLAGARLYLARREDLLPGKSLSHYLETHAITFALLSPSVLATMDSLPATLQTLLVGGEACSPTLVKRWAKGRRMINAYGPTETTVCVAMYLCDSQENKAPPIGYPISNSQIYILDKYHQPVPTGVTGEIYIAGACVARGYLNRPELTAERFLTNPFSADHGARMYKTGDLGRWLPDGRIEYLGRNDFQIKLRGLRIELGEIEARLRQCDGVHEAVVLPYSSNYYKNSSHQNIPDENSSVSKQLVAYLLPETNLLPGANIRPEPMALRQQLSQHLAEYMIPSAFVTLDAFPLTPSGKLDREALPKPDHTSIVTRHYQAPVGEFETTLSQLWQRLLGVKYISRNDHFFELGGHSLLAVRLIEQLRSLGWAINIRTVFAKPVLNEMAQAILSVQQGATQENVKREDPPAFTVPANLIPDGCTAITPDMLTLVSLSQHEIDAITAAIPGGAANIQDIYPLTPLQEGIFFHYLLQQQGDTYLLRNLLAFESRERLDSFLSALQQVINHHDILHTSIFWQGLEHPVQVVWRQALLSINTFSPKICSPTKICSPNSELSILDQLLAYTDPHQYRLNISQAPLFSADIVYDPLRAEWLLALCIHHLACDHVTLESIVSEISELLRNHTHKLPPVLPYRNFVAQSLNVPASAHEDYFREVLSDVDEPTVSFGILDVHSGDKKIAEARQPIDATLAKAIRTQAKRQGVSASILFHTALALVLAKVSGRDDVVFGTVLLGRMQGSTGINQAMGLLINTLPIRVKLTDNSVQTTVQETSQNLIRLLEHEQATLTQAQNCSGIAPSLPLFNTLLNYRHSQSALTFNKWEGIRLLMQEERINYPFGLFVDDWGDGFSLVAQTVSDIEPIRLINYMTTALTGLVNALETTPHQPILDIPILPARERQQLLVDFNTAQPSQDAIFIRNTVGDSPQHTLIHQLVEKQVQHTPDAIAVIFEEQSLSYAELNRQANRVAHHLLALGVRPDNRVAICTERSLEMIVGLLAILKAGGAYVPLDPSQPAERLAYMLEDAAPVALLTQTPFVYLINQLTDSIPVVDLSNSECLLADMPDNNPDPDSFGLTSDHLAYVIYTSGSTGVPKGVMNEHRAVMNSLLWAQKTYQFTPQDRVLQKTPFSFDVSVWELFPPLMFGARLILARPEGHKDPHYLLSVTEKHKITIIHFVPSMLQLFLSAIPAGRCLSLRHILCSGEAFPYTLQQKCLSHFTHCQLHNLYGPTEAAIHVTAWRCVTDQYIGRIPIGKPIDNIRIYLLDNQGNPVPVGVAGELYIGGSAVARGYLNLPELTNKHFVSDPFSSDPDARLYKSGDLAHWLPDGNIEYLGRNDFQVKIRGFRIELGEIEAKLTQCHGVREAAVIACEDDYHEKTVGNEKPSGDKQLIAYLLAEPDTKPDPAVLREQLAQHLAEYMLPSAFMILDAFPLTSSGKLNRKALPIPDQTARVTRYYEAPVGAIETALAEIWQELLKLEHIGRYDHFFELGGHSLLAIQLATRIRQKLARELPLQVLFSHPVLADLAVLIADVPVTAQTIIPAADRSQNLPLSFSQQRLWFLTRLNTEVSLAYQIPTVLRLSGDLDHAALATALDQLVSRHESLRTRFVLVDEQPYQHIDDVNTGFVLTHQDLRSLDETDRMSRVNERVKLERQTAFDFANESMIREQLLQLSDKEHVLILIQHHIITDGWSLGILLRELSTFYSVALGKSAALGKNGVPLPHLPIQYADYAVWQQKLLQSEDLAVQKAFWQKQLQDAPALLSLPTDYPRPPEQNYTGDHIPVHLNADLLSALRALGQRQNTTLFMTLLTAWSIVLTRLSGQNDIVIGTPVANRSHSELEGLIGFFVNTLPLRLETEQCSTVADLLTHVRDRSLAAYAHQDLPFEQLVEILHPERSLSHNPIFQVMLALNNTTEPTLEMPGLSASLMEQPHSTAYFDLTLSLTETQDGLSGYLEYASSLFDRTTVERIVGYLTNVLTAMIADETQSINRLPMLSVAERQQLLTDFNEIQPVESKPVKNTFADFSHNTLIQQLFEEQAQRTPDAMAVIFAEESLSYGELNRLANQLAHSLIAFGVRPDDRVAIHVERGLEMIIGLLGILKAGAGYVPLDPEYPVERLTYQLSDSKPVILLTQKHLQTRLPVQDIPIWLLDDETHQERMQQQPADNPDSRQTGIQPHHLAYIIYTSGSTGKPKGVMLEHHNVVSLIYAHCQLSEPGPQDRVLQFVTFAFDISVSDIFPTLASGATLVLRPAYLKVPDSTFADFLHEQKVTIINVPTAFWHHWTQEIKAGRSSFSSRIHTIIVGGDKVEPRCLMDWFSCPETAACRWFNAYGPTEITITATAAVVNREMVMENNSPVSSVSSISHNIPIGRPLSNTRLYILDKFGQPVPIGVSGEIYIGGMGVARGYLNQPELTAEKFVIDPFSEQPNARMYKTGDLARWRSDGNVEYLGRNDFQVKIRGFRIELGEIETRLLQCQGVHEAIVLAREETSAKKAGDTKTRHDKRLVAYLIAEPDKKPEPAELRRQLAQHLADYMLPSAFVILDEFPLAPNGKLDRQALPAPDQAAIVTRTYSEPQGEKEAVLAEIWQALLGLEKVGRYDHFFELGGHSLMIINLIERLRNRGWSLNIREVFVTPILAEMAKTMQVTEDNPATLSIPPNLIPDGCTTITPDMLPLVSLTQHEIDTIAAGIPAGASNIQDIYPLAPLQEGMLFHHLMQTQGDVYLLHTLFAFDTRERLDAFLHALQQLINRHDILRTAICWERLTQPVQVVWRQASLHINTFIPGKDNDIPSQLLAYTEPYQRRLDISQAPLFSADITYDPHQGEWLLAFCCHHILNDHVSLDHIIDEIRDLLHQRIKPLPAALPYRHFIAQFLRIPPANHEAFFREMLADVDTPTVPFGILDIYSENRPITEIIKPLNASLSRAVRKQARRYGVSPGVLFHVALAQMLAKINGRDDVVFGTVLLGRMQGNAGIEQTLGLFINTLPVRIRLAENSVQETVQATYTNLTRLLEHEQASLAQAQRCSGIAPPLPLFNTLLNYRHSQSNVTDTLWEGIRLVTGKERTNYPLYLAVDDLSKGFLLSVQAIAGIDPAYLITSMMTALSELVQALENEPQKPIMDIATLTTAERQKLMADFAAVQTGLPPAMPISVQPTAVAPDYQAPIGRVEIALAEIWQELLEQEQIGRHDNFFSLGGHSLIAVQLLARLRKQNMDIPLALLFTRPTLCELAEAIPYGFQVASQRQGNESPGA